MRKAFCRACYNFEKGIKTRKRVNHTCGKEQKIEVVNPLEVSYVNLHWINEKLKEGWKIDVSISKLHGIHPCMVTVHKDKFKDNEQSITHIGSDLDNAILEFRTEEAMPALMEEIFGKESNNSTSEDSE